VKYLFVCCEGATEEAFVEKILAPYFKDLEVCVTPSRMKGVTNFEKIKEHLTGFCKSFPYARITTMIDYYGLQKAMPSFMPTDGDIYKRVQFVEEKVMSELHTLGNLDFNIILHEFEGLLFSDVTAFDGIASKSQLLELQNIRCRAETPEHINDKYETAPSRRIIGQIPDYSKTLNGIKVAHRIGVDKMSDECRHFKQWIEKLTVWAKDGVQ